MGSHKTTTKIDIEVFCRQPGAERFIPLAFGFEHQRKRPLGAPSIEPQIGSELLTLAQQEYYALEKRSFEKQPEMISTYMVEVRGYHFGFWKAEFATKMVRRLLKGDLPLEDTSFTVNRARGELGWNFSIPEERNTVLYALQTMIDHFNNYK